MNRITASHSSTVPEVLMDINVKSATLIDEQIESWSNWRLNPK